MADLRLSEILRVIRMIDDGITTQAVANQFDISIEKVMSIMQTRKKFESLDKFSPSEPISVLEIN